MWRGWGGAGGAVEGTSLENPRASRRPARTARRQELRKKSFTGAMTWSFRGTPPGAPPAMSLAPSAAAALPSASAVASVRLARRPALAPGRLARVALASSPALETSAPASSSRAPPPRTRRRGRPPPSASRSAPGGSRSRPRPPSWPPSGTTAFDAELVRGLVTAPFSGATNPIFEALFNSLGVVPAVYAALLLPGAKDQPRCPAALPIAASFALGFFALGPYLILREPRAAPVPRSSLGWLARVVLESKPFAALNAAFALFLVAYGVTHADRAAIDGFATLWTEQSALCCVSSCDLLVLSLAMVGPAREDAAGAAATRRGPSRASPCPCSGRACGCSRDPAWRSDRRTRA